MAKFKANCVNYPEFNKQNNIKELLLKAGGDIDNFDNQINNASDKLQFFLSQGSVGRRFITRDPDLMLEFTQLGMVAKDLEALPNIHSNIWDEADKIKLTSDAMMMMRMSNMLSSFKTSWANAIGGTYQLLTTPLFETTGRAILSLPKPHKIPHEVKMGLMQYHAMGHQFKGAMRLAAISAKEGVGLWDVKSYSTEHLDDIADEIDGKYELNPGKSFSVNDAPTAYTVNNIHPGINNFAKFMWRLQTAPLRMLSTTDTFFKALGGNANHFARRYGEAYDDYYNEGFRGADLRKAATDKAHVDLQNDLKDAIIRRGDGSVREVKGAIMMDPDALNFGRNLTFTNPIWPDPVRRTKRMGRRLAEKQGIKDPKEIDDYANDYIQQQKDYNQKVELMMGIGRPLSTLPHMIDSAKRSQVGPLVSLVAPFVKSPTSFVKTAAQYTPLAPLSDTWIRDIMSPDKSTRALAVGQVALGTLGVGSIVYSMVNSENLEFAGDGPANELANTKWRYGLGKQRRSFRMKQPDGSWGDWYSYDIVEPLGTLIAAITDWTEMSSSMSRADQETTGAALGLWFTQMMNIKPEEVGYTGLRVGSGIIKSNWVSGIHDFIQAIEETGQEGAFTDAKRNPISKALSRLAITSFAPFSSMIRKAQTDRTQEIKKVPRSNFIDEFSNEMKKAGLVPSWGDNEMAKIRHTITGEIIIPTGSLGRRMFNEDDPAFLGFFPQMWSLGVQSTPSIDSPGLSEIRRHTENGSDFYDPIYSRFIGQKHMRLTDNYMTDEEHEAWIVARTTLRHPDYRRRTLSQTLDTWVSSRDYQRLPDNIVEGEKSDAIPNAQAQSIQDILRDYNVLADEAFLESPVGQRIADNIRYYEDKEHVIEDYTEGYGKESKIAPIIQNLTGNI